MAIGRSLADGEGWQATPIVVAEGNRWYSSWHSHGRGHSERDDAPHASNVREYIGRYGYDIPIDARRVEEVDRVIQSPGSYYRYGKGGSVTIVSPAKGKVYFFYAG